MRPISTLQLVLVILVSLALATVAHAQQCSLVLNVTQGYLNITTNAQSIGMHAWGVVGIRNTTACNIHYVAFKYSLAGMSSLIYIHASSNGSDYLIINYTYLSRRGYALLCIATNPLHYDAGLITASSSNGEIMIYCSLLNRDSLAYYGVLLGVLIAASIASLTYFLIKGLTGG